MVRLVLDTSFNYLHIYLMDANHHVIDGLSNWCPKRQSESIMPLLDELCRKNKIEPSDIGEVVVADGPGSYTGLRIALAIAKVLAIEPNVKVATICSLDLVFGCNGDGYAIMDARSKRVYMAHYTNNRLDQLTIIELEEFKQLVSEDTIVYGQASLIGRDDKYANLAECLPMMEQRLSWVQDPFQLKPRYLKENDAYDPHKKSESI